MRQLLVFSISLAVVAGLFPVAGADGVEFYVSPSGSDGALGTKAKPFASISRARDEIRALSARKKSSGVTVWVREGAYNFDESLIFEARDSGTEKAPITYSAYPGEGVVLKGSLKLDAKWKSYKDGIYVCSLAGTPLEDVETTQLFCEDRRMVRARYPDWDFEDPLRSGKGYLHCKDGDLTQMTWRPGQLDDKKGKWANPETGILHAFHRRNWGNMQYRIAGIDWDKRQVLLGEGGLQCQRRDGPGVGRGDASPYYIENIFEELDSPHEWFHDVDNKRLYFYPPKGADISKARIEAATLPRLIEFRGSAKKPVHHINLKGFHVTQSQSTFMSEYEDLGRGDWAIHRGGAIYFLGAEDCRVDDCLIEQVGGNGVFADGYNRRISIAGCLIEDIGDSAVCFVGSSDAVRHFFTWEKDNREGGEITDFEPGPKSPDYSEDCSVSNTIMRNVGVYGKQTSAVLVSMSVGVTISHCTLYGIPRAGITFNDGVWGGHVLEYCDIWDTVMETGEHGPFNGWGRGRFWTGLKKDLVLLDAMKTTHIRNNRIANMRPAISAGNWTIDLDDGCSNYEIYNNLSLGSTLKLRDGYYRKVYNNIHVSAVPLGWHCWPADNEDTFERNITVVAGATEGHNEPTLEMIKVAGPMSDHPWGKRHGDNLWWNVNTDKFLATSRSGKPVETWKEWRKLGYGEGSVLGDPMFVDPVNGDYRVRVDSPALQVGFKNFPMDQFGHEMTRIEPFGCGFEKEQTVKLRSDARGGEVRYTLDGSVPTRRSKRYKKPLRLAKTTTLRAQTFDDGLKVGFETQATFRKVDEAWRPSWLESLMAGKWVAQDDVAAKKTTRQSQKWRGMTVCNLADDGDLIDASGGHDYGVYIEQVPTGSQAVEWGFKIADVIVAVNGRKTADFKALEGAITKARGDSLTVSVLRGYAEIDIKVPAGR